MTKKFFFIFILSIFFLYCCVNIKESVANSFLNTSSNKKKDDVNYSIEKEKKRLEKAITKKDIKTLKEIVENKDSSLSLEDKKVALLKLKEFITEDILKKVNFAFNNNDLKKVENILNSKDVNYLLEEKRIKIIYRLKDAKKDRILGNIKKAIDDIDLQKISEILNSEDAKYLKFSDKDFAQKYLDQYLKRDVNAYTYQQRGMELKIRKVPEDIKKNIFIYPEKYIEPLVKYLTLMEDNIFLKVKIIHDWICDNISYDVEMYLSRNITNQDYINILKKRKAVCYGYSNLFKEMTKIAGFKDCLIIKGYLKDGEYNKFDYFTSHAWNAIKIANKWYIIDCTLDSGNVNGKAFYFNKNYSTAYFFIDPRANLYTHYPENSKYQFYIPILSKEEFLEEPFIPGQFFYYGLNIIDKNIKKSNIVSDDNFLFLLKCFNSNTSLLSSIESIINNFKEDIKLVKVDSFTYKVEYKFIEKGSYVLNIYAKSKQDKNFENPILVQKFESFILPKINNLIEEGKISEKEKEIFINSFTKIEEDNVYYYNEDIFDYQRINTVIKIMQLIGDSLNCHKNVLSIKFIKD